jgi:hypothetical protein
MPGDRKKEWSMTERPTRTAGAVFALVLAGGVAGACTPTVKLAAPDKPITINLNVKIDQEVRVKLDKDIENLIATNPDLF